MYPFHGLYQRILDQEDNEHREIFFDFFITFSRFEYALKRAGYVNTSGGKASANWDTFASAYEGEFDPGVDAALQEAVNFLINNAPKKQAYEAGNLIWRDSTRNGEPYMKWVSLLIRTIRNNLFHGEKFRMLLGHSSLRNYDLVKSSLIVLNNWLKLNPELHRYFFAEMEWELKYP